MKKIKLGLFPKVVIAIVIGALLGLILPDVVIRIFKTFNVLFAQLLKFVVPLLVLGLVTPSIANLGRGAGKMLLTVMLIAYCSTVCGALFSYGISSNILPMYLTPGELSAEAVSEKEFLPFIDLKIPPICDIMTALVLSFVVGVGIIFTGARIPLAYLLSHTALGLNGIWWTLTITSMFKGIAFVLAFQKESKKRALTS